MKKVLLLIVACIAAFASANVSAADLYIRGGNFGWAASDCKDANKFTDNGDGTYTITLAELKSGFKIADSTWGANNWGSANNCVLDQEYTLTNSSGSGNITIQGGGSWNNVTITFNATTGKMKATGQATGVDWSNIDMYIMGPFNSWDFSKAGDYKMTLEGDVYSITLESLSGMFAFSAVNWDHKFSYIDVTLQGNAKDKVVNVPEDNNNFKTTTTLTNVTFKLNVKTNVLTIDADASSVEPDPTPGEAVTITGDYNLAYSGDKANVYYWGASNPNWPGIAMTSVTGSDGKTYKVAKVPAGTTGLVFNTNGDENKTGDLTYTSEYVMNDNGATTTPVVFVSGGDDPNPPTPEVTDLVLVGSFNDWAKNDASYKMTADGNTYTFTMASLEAGAEFKVKTAEDNWDTSWGAEGPMDLTEATAQEMTVGVPMNAWKGSENNFKVAEALTDVTFTFVMSADASVASTLTITGTAADVPTPVEDLYMISSFSPIGFNFVVADAATKMTAEGNNVFSVAVNGVSAPDAIIAFTSTPGSGSANGAIVPMTEEDVALSASAPVNAAVFGVAPYHGDHFSLSLEEIKKYTITVDLNTMTVALDVQNGIESIDADSNCAAEYFNLQGIRVANPVAGQVYLVRRGNNVSKVLVK